MDCEHKLKVLEQEIESLKEENRLLKEKLSSSEKNFRLITIYIIIFRRLFRQVGVLQPIMNWMWTGRFIIMKIVFSP